MVHLDAIHPAGGHLLDELVGDGIVAPPHARVRDHADAAGLVDDRERVDGCERVLLDVRAATVADERVGVRVVLDRDHAGLHQRLRDVRADDVLAGGDLPDAFEAHGVAELLELLHHPLAPPQPRLLQPEQLGLELQVLLVRPVREDVKTHTVVLRGELDAGDQLQAGQRGCGPGLGDAGDGVVVGEGHGLQSALPAQIEQLGRRQRAVGETGVRVQVDPGHGR